MPSAALSCRGTLAGMTSDSAADGLLPGLREPAHRVSRRAVQYWTARAAVNGLAIVAAEVAGTVHARIMPRWRYRVHRWEVTDQALYTRSGWFSIRWRIAPISRIQTIDSSRSFRERMCGLANVTATTASAAGPVHIRGLDRATADRLLDELTVATAAILGDAT